MALAITALGSASSEWDLCASSETAVCGEQKPHGLPDGWVLQPPGSSETPWRQRQMCLGSRKAADGTTCSPESAYHLYDSVM